MSTVYSVLDTRDKNELNQTIANTKTELQKNIDTLEDKHDSEVTELQGQIDTLESEKATKAELSSHNTSNSAHNDIRLLIQGLTTRLNALADSDDTTLDQMSEIVAYIEANRDLIESITTSKISVSDIINNLTTNVTNKPLSAAMGVTLKALIDAIPDNTNAIVDEKIQEHNLDADAHEDIRTDVLNVQSTASGAQVSADNAQAAADAAQADVDDALSRLNSLEVGSGKLDREVSTEDGIVTCEDALPDSGLIETKFYGKTVQNLWANPNGTQNGVTITSNASGSISVGGTTTGNISLNSGKKYILKKSTLYTLSVNKKLSDSLTDPSNGSFFIEQHRQDDSLISGSTRYVGYGNALSVTFRTSGELSYVYMGVFAVSGKTLSGTYHVMLRETTEAEIAAAANTLQTLPVYPDGSGSDASDNELAIMPLNEVSTLADSDFDDYWCPPGISSIDNLNISTSGANLFTLSGLKGTFFGVTYSENENGEISGIGTSTTSTIAGDYIRRNYPIKPNTNYTLSVDRKSDYLIPYIGIYSNPMFMNRLDDMLLSDRTSVSIRTNPKAKYILYGMAHEGLNIDSGSVKVMFNEGDIALPWEKTEIISTTIDLQGYSLNSLPDGTRDELRIDKDGNVTLIQRVANASFTADDLSGNNIEYAEASIGIASQGYVYSSGVRGNSESGDTINDFALNSNPDDVSGIVKCWVFSLETNKVPTGNVVARIGNGKTENSAAAQLNSLKSIIGDRTIHVLYKLYNPKTIQLGTIDPPRLPSSTSHVWINGTAATTNFVLPVNDLSVRYWLPNGELVADIYENGATEELSDTEIISIWNGVAGDIVEASSADIEAIFEDE